MEKTDFTLAHADELLDHLVAAVTSVPDPTDRSRLLTHVLQRLNGTAGTPGITATLAEARAKAYRDRLNNGETLTELARAEGLAVPRAHSIIKRTGAPVVTPGTLTARREQTTARRDAAKVAQAAAQAARAAEQARTRAHWHQRYINAQNAGKPLTIVALAAEAGVTRKTMAGWLRSAANPAER